MFIERCAMVSVALVAAASSALAEPLHWAPVGAANPRPMGVESNGTITYSCEANIGGMWLIGRTWFRPGETPHCHIGSAGKTYDPTSFNVLVGDGGTLKHFHHGGWAPNVVKGDSSFIAPCVALRATGELVPGYLKVGSPNPNHSEENCEYSYNANTHESHYLLLEAPGETQVPLATDSHVEGCTDDFCKAFDAIGNWIAASPIRAIVIVGVAAILVDTCVKLGGSVGAAAGGLGGPPGAAAGGAAGGITAALTCTWRLVYH